MNDQTKVIVDFLTLKSADAEDHQIHRRITQFTAMLSVGVVIVGAIAFISLFNLGDLEDRVESVLNKAEADVKQFEETIDSRIKVSMDIRIIEVLDENSDDISTRVTGEINDAIAVRIAEQVQIDGNLLATIDDVNMARNESQKFNDETSSEFLETWSELKSLTDEIISLSEKVVLLQQETSIGVIPQIQAEGISVTSPSKGQQ